MIEALWDDARMALLLILTVCAYLLYRLVKAVENKQNQAHTRTHETTVTSTRQHARLDEESSPMSADERDGRRGAVREAALKDLLATIGKLEEEYLGLVREDYINGGHMSDCYVEGTKVIRSLLNRLGISTSALLAGALPQPDVGALTAAAEALEDQAEAEVKKLGYPQTVNRQGENRDGLR